ncbi:flagellar biosynthesis protein FlhA [Candidatus Nitronereus thalassa]|uniref:Flagellar biosynthesis protein FlhA n=1 Tax=Candidatus Nitronereus thalassa TaxID=3020898 RepID=A0ABU3K6D5_9BACT|nr:flagellar biosynthesis protein FlhA [Candidatus Nitronereus thalassa]MDT7041903.1 flagellar biosynthesis protein FlhA [Candidatus Nitronereus thalassa]
MAVSSTIEKPGAMFGSYNDFLLPMGVIGLLMLMLVPLPPLLLDLFLSFSITLAILVLFVTMNAKRPIDFSVFPSVLLLVTLFRLALNIASTRVILLNGSEGMSAAGEVIKSFGSFVVGGNFAVGIVVFSILVIINFVVITKGAGRIAEVAARFTLDAMPGKQMSIDADLNAGLIDEATARRRREDIAEEADFYGSMDGASKFVRGDAIASIIIILINIVGGLAIGVLEYGMPLVEAAHTFTLLTVGDALVAQIPALIISTAAGIIITRAASSTNLGEQITKQIFVNPDLIGMVAGILFLLGLTPGLPHFAFLLLGAMVAGLAYALKEHQKTAAVKEKAAAPKKGEEGAKGDAPDVVTPPDLLELHVGYGLVPLVDVAQGGELLERIRGIRKQTGQELGLVVPPVHIRDNLQLRPNEYSIMLKGVQVAKGEVVPRHLLAINPGQATGELEGKPAQDPCFGLPAVWISSQTKEKAQVEGYTVVDCGSVIATHLTEIIRANGYELIGRQEVQSLLENIAKTHPKVVDDLIPTLLPLGTVVRILKNLLKERVSIRDLRTILESVADYATQVKDPDVLTDYARQSLGRTITSQFITPDGLLPVISLDPGLDRRLVDALRPSPTGEVQSMSPTFVNTFLENVRRSIERVITRGYQPVLLCSHVIRSHVYRLVAPSVQALTVLSPNEIDVKAKIQAIEVVRMPDEA